MSGPKSPCNKWLHGDLHVNAGKKGTSAHQLHRTLGVTYKSAWFMAHRIREAMRDEGLEPLGRRWQDRRSRRNLLRQDRESEPPDADHAAAGPSPRRQAGPATSAPSSRLSSAAVGSHVPCRCCRCGERRADRARQHRPREPRCIPTKADSTRASAQNLPRTKPSITPPRNTPRGDVHDQHASKAISQCSSAVCAASISIAARSICTAISRNLISATINRSAFGINDGERAALAIKGADGKRLTYRPLTEP